MIFDEYKLILGSKSPRRKLLLEGLGFDVEVRIREIDEKYPEILPLEEIPAYLAIQKANAFNEDKFQDNEILVTADTVVLADDKLLGKPKNEKEAIQMLLLLSGRMHHVITGICLKSNKIQKSFSAFTKVHFRELNLEEISFYIHKYRPFDKAGSYGIQEWIGYIGVEYIEGSYYNVMGLPTQMLYRQIENLIKYGQ